MQSEQQQQQLLSELDVTADLAAKDCLISLFAYENTEVQSLLTALSQAQQNITLLVPQGRVSDDVSTWFGKKITMGKERSEEHTSELQSRPHLVCRLLLEKKKKK